MIFKYLEKAGDPIICCSYEDNYFLQFEVLCKPNNVIICASEQPHHHWPFLTLTIGPNIIIVDGRLSGKRNISKTFENNSEGFNAANDLFRKCAKEKVNEHLNEQLNIIKRESKTNINKILCIK